MLQFDDVLNDFLDWTKWTASGPRNKKIDFDLDLDVLQIQTDSKIGSGDIWSVLFEHQQSDKTPGTGIRVQFSDPPAFLIDHCGENTEFVIDTIETPRVWTFRKLDKYLALLCSGKLVFEIDYRNTSYPDLCRYMWSSDFEYMIFRNETTEADGKKTETDNASDLIRKYTSGMEVFNLDLISIFEISVFDQNFC